MPYLRPSRLRSAMPAALVFAVLLSPDAAHAGGFELTSAGARANGRAGANYVGSDSPLSMFYNPANLARLEGYHLLGALHLHASDRCMRRVDVDETVQSTDPLVTEREEGDETFGRVCADGPLAVIPQLGFSAELADGLTLGAGVYAPPVAYRKFHFGDPGTVTHNDDAFTPRAIC